MNTIINQKKQWNQDFEENYTKKIKREKVFEKFYIISLTIIFSSLGIFSGIFSYSETLSIKDLAFCAFFTSFFIGYIFHPRTIGRAYVVGRMNMENNLAIAFGFAVVFFFSGLGIWSFNPGRTYLLIIFIILTILGIALIYKGFDDGPSYGWYP